MTDFQLDTTGEVRTPTTPAARPGLRWADLTPFTQGYIEALIKAANQTLSFNPKHPFRPNGFSDLAPETLARIIADCAAVQAVGLPDTLEAGQTAWEARQQGMTHFPPLIIQLGDDGKVRFADDC